MVKMLVYVGSSVVCGAVLPYVPTYMQGFYCAMVVLYMRHHWIHAAVHYTSTHMYRFTH